MKKTGATELPLHRGKCPPWLFKYMKKLGGSITNTIVQEFSKKELLHRLSNPYFFQSLGCVLGYDFHSSGLTTVTTAVLKEIIQPEDLGIYVCGGKGKASKQTPSEIEKNANSLSIPHRKIQDLKYASKMSAKVDNAAVQDGAPLYHHAFFGTKDGEWTVIQQGMDAEKSVARRYHWVSEGVDNFVIEPHKAILAEKRIDNVLDMTAELSGECRKTSTDLVKDDPQHIQREFDSLLPEEQKSLTEWVPKAGKKSQSIKYLSLPKRMNWNAIEKAHELQPKNYEELLTIKGIGPATTRGLALVSEIIYGDSASWQDPAKFSFAFGGKDGIPYPVNKASMDKAHKVLKSAVEEAEIGRDERLKAIKRLESFSDSQEE